MTRNTHEISVDADSTRFNMTIAGVLRDATGLPISIADDPLSCVALGTGRCLEELRTLRNVLIGA